MAGLSATILCPEVVVEETSCSQTAIEQNALTSPNNTAPRCDESPAPQPCRCQGIVSTQFILFLRTRANSNSVAARVHL